MRLSSGPYKLKQDLQIKQSPERVLIQKCFLFCSWQIQFVELCLLHNKGLALDLALFTSQSLTPLSRSQASLCKESKVGVHRQNMQLL